MKLSTESNAMSRKHQYTGTDPIEIAEAVDALCSRYEREWQDSNPSSIESCLVECTPHHRSAALYELLLVDIELLRKRGAEFSEEGYLRRFPEYSDVVREAFAAAAPSTRPTLEYLQPTKGMRVSCPHCQQVMTLDKSANSSDVECLSCESAFRVTETLLLTGERPDTDQIGHFRLVERLGSGAFGTVWKACDTKLDRSVAIKIPLRGQLTEEEEEQFLREARSAAQLNHPNIVSVHEVGRAGETLYLVSDLIHGCTLTELIDERLPAHHESAMLVAKLAGALHHAHEQGVVHRDLKPHNVLMDAANEPHLTDFGLAKRESGEATATLDGTILGTPAYMSPEQASGESNRVDRRTDVYSLGVILYQMLTGELPFRGAPRMMMHKVIHEEPLGPRRLNDRIPADLENICLKCLEKSPSNRYQNAQSLQSDLRNYLEGKPVSARPISTLKRADRWARRHPAATTAIGLGIILLGTLSLGLVLLAQAKSRADRSLQIAEAEERTSATTIELLKRLLETNDPIAGAAVGWRQAGNKADETLKDILERADPQLVATLAQNDPEVATEVLLTIGDVCRTVGLYEHAEKLLAESLRLSDATQKNRFSADRHARPKACFLWGWLCHDLGDFDGAASHYQEARRLYLESIGENSQEITDVDFNRAWLLADVGKPNQSIELFRRVLDKRRQLYDSDDALEVRLAALALKMMLIIEGKHVDALLVELTVGGTDDELFDAIHTVEAAKASLNSGEARKAVALYTQVAEQAEARFNVGHPFRIFLKVELAGAHQAAGDVDSAQATMKHAMEESRQLVSIHPKFVLPVAQFAETLAMREQKEFARQLFELAIMSCIGNSEHEERIKGMQERALGESSEQPSS